MPLNFFFSGRHLVVINREKLKISLDPIDDPEINDSTGKVFRTVKTLYA